jgi:hypothetical protein
LYPFKWCQAYIPILPESNLEAIGAPMPIIVGVMASHIEQLEEILDEIKKEEEDDSIDRLIVKIDE